MRRTTFGGPATRRAVLGQFGLGALALGTARAAEVRLPLPSDPRNRAMTGAFPQKGQMILQRTRPPLLETPFEVFDQGVFTPNDRFFVRWHWAVIPESVDAAAFRLTVRGHVDRPLSQTLAEVLAMPRVELAAVNQCSGNSRGLFEPRIAGAQWANGSMGNAKWVGVRLRDVLDRAGVKGGAVAVRFNGLDEPVVPEAPDFMKSLDVDHARDGEVMIAYQMNNEQLPLLNGFPLRLIVPSWYSTYWVKMLTDVEVLDAPDQSFWMKTAYRIPDTPHASVKPGETGFKTVPINRMVPRSWFTGMANGDSVKTGAPVPLRGIAMGGDRGVKAVDVSTNGGVTWTAAKLGADEGTYSFRRWTHDAVAPAAGVHLAAIVRCTNADGVVQPLEQPWNPAGFMRDGVETLTLSVA